LIWRVMDMNRQVNIRIIDKFTGRESKALTYKFMAAMKNYDYITLPEKFRIAIR
jgi:hypothetical protein